MTRNMRELWGDKADCGYGEGRKFYIVIRACNVEVDMEIVNWPLAVIVLGIVFKEFWGHDTELPEMGNG